jgi:hypothetical protein
MHSPVPRTDEIQGRIGRSKPAHIDDPGQAVAGDEYVAGYQVAMCHPIRHSVAGQFPKLGP